MRVSFEEELVRIFPGDSYMAEVMRRHDWSNSPLGDPRVWPSALKIPLKTLLTSRFEMWIGWGPDLLFFYNDAYAPTMGVKHPHMFGRPLREVWSEVYDDVSDQIARVRAGEATWNKALLLLLERSGYPEETYHSFSYSPLYGSDGSVEGLQCIVTEETARIISERRLETVRRLGMTLVHPADKAAVVEAVRETFEANRQDFPFVLFLLAGEPTGAADAILFDEIKSELPAKLTEEGAFIALSRNYEWPCGGWSTPPREAIVIAVPGSGGRESEASLILALNPYRRDDPDTLSIARLIAGQIGGALANVAALTAARRRADRLWSNSRDLIVMIDADGYFRSVSPSWGRIFGTDPDKVVGRHFREFMHPDDVGSSKKALAQALEEEELTGFHNRLRAMDGSYRDIEWHTSREEGIVYAYGRDVTERKEAQRDLEAAREALFQSQKMEAVGQLTGGIAHDFNNLLMAVLSSLDLLGRRIGDDPQTGRLIANATKAAERGASLTQRMLAFARRQELKVDPVPLLQLLNGMNDLLQRTVGPEWQILMQYPLNLPAVRADANQLEMALINLIVNARDATPSGGPITVAASCEEVTGTSATELVPGRYVRLEISDHGMGMDAETLRRATEPFYTTKEVGKGTGLGLAMVHGMAKQISGAFELESQPEAGTKAILWLPVWEGNMEQVEQVESVQQFAEKSDLNVLLVDDDPLVRMGTYSLLEDLGHRVFEAGSAAEALEILNEQGDIDLIITDQAMPGKTGAALIAEIDKLRPGIPAIIASGYTHSIAGAGREVATLGKPFTMTQLRNAIENTMGAPHAA